MYLLLADDSVANYTSKDNWQPALHPYQAEGAANLGYLKHVLLSLLDPKPNQDESPLLQVVFVFLQFSEAEIARVVAARAAASKGGGRSWGIFR